MIKLGIVLTVILVLLVIISGAFRVVSRSASGAGGTRGDLSLKRPKDKATRVIGIAGRSVLVMVADTLESRQQGLSGHPGLASDEGMLFIFPEDGRHAFWMKDMFFPIDIIWLSATGAVVSIAPSVSPDTYPQNFMPDAPARYVVELPAGFAHTYDLKKGDMVQL